MAPASEPRADSRDMIGAHKAMRREFGATPALVAAVASGDQKRAAVVAGHLDFLVEHLDVHHSCEDEEVWPKLHERCPAEVAPLIDTMEAQHQGIHAALTSVTELSQAWRLDAGQEARDAIVTELTGLVRTLNEHLDLEEAEVLPLIDTYLSEKEWRAAVAAAGPKTPKSRMPLSFGMTLYGAEDEMVALMKAAVPKPVWTIFAPIGRGAYARHAKKVYGTREPALDSFPVA
jgi:hemerythrin-like domain-containing protein